MADDTTHPEPRAGALDEYPRQLARTRGFTLGMPRSFTVSPDGERVVFLRSKADDDPVSCLWALDVTSGNERCLFDPREHGTEEDDDTGLSAAERSRRERVRERSTGVTAYATDRDVRRIVFSVSGRPFLADLTEGWVDDLTVPGVVDDPRLDPMGQRVAYVVDGNLHVREIDGGNRVLAGDDDPDRSWGLPEFVAAEEMQRFRGHWWSPDGRSLAAAHVDQRRVQAWYIADPTDPDASPRPVRYPAAGTEDAVVRLFVFEVATGSRVEVTWDRSAFPYLARVHWSAGGPLTLFVQSRDQRRAQVLEADAGSGAATLVEEHEDPQWLDLPEDAPLRLSDGRLVMVAADRDEDSNRLTVGGEPVTPPGLQVVGILSAEDDVLFTGSEEPTEVHLWRWTDEAGAVRISGRPGVHAGARGGDVLVRVSSTMDAPLPDVRVVRGGQTVARIERVGDEPVISAAPLFLTLGSHELRAALLLPGGAEPEAPLPVLVDPYGGPHHRRVFRSQAAHLTSQWFAEHGFAVLVVDGRGTGGRGPGWDREMHHDLALALEDQVEALEDASSRFAFLDRSRVAIRGWSFGGYLSALAVLRRPDVFHAGIAGAPVTDWRLYDTHYTERYLGHPDEAPEVYARNSLLADAPNLERPLLLIHGLADDNVVAAHTLQLSTALFEAGRFHELVLIPSATHLTRSTAVTENVLRVQLDFVRRALSV